MVFPEEVNAEGECSEEGHSELLDHRPGVGAHPSPPQKGFGSLFDQHAHAIGHAGHAGRARLFQERGEPLAIHHLVGQRAGGEHAGRQGQRVLRQAG